MKYTDIAWDFDGTLADSYPNCTRALTKTLKELGLTRPEEEVRSLLIVTTGDALSHYAKMLEMDVRELRRLYKEEEKRHPELIVPFPGICEVLQAIKESGRRNHLYTNRNRDAIDYMERMGLLPYFDGLLTSEEYSLRKPDPCGMLILMEKYQVEPSRMLMVGDRSLDLEASKAAGGDGCFYNTNGTPVPDSADFVVEDIRDLLNYL